MQAYVAKPERSNGAGVIVLQEAFGVNAYIRDIADRFAKEGYIAIAPELFHRTAPAGFETPYTEMDRSHMTALTDTGIVSDMRASYDFLAGEGVQKIGVVGFCMGGRAAFLADATLPVTAAVSFYGGGIAQTLLDKTKDLTAPILLLWGGKDAHILPEHRRAVADSLDKEGKFFVDVVFSDANHGFFCDHRASYSKEASEEAWPLVLQFLRTHLS